MATSLSLRPYQQRIVDSIQNENAIIKMPTGSGKTFVAAEFVRRLKDGRAIFLVPTIALVEQQALAIEDWCQNGGDGGGGIGGSNTNSSKVVARYSGGMDVPENYFDVLVSTPQAFYMLQTKDNSFAWGSFRLCIFDEVHHVLKDHPYRKLAKRLKRQDIPHIQIIGLSASLTYAVGEHEIQTVLTRLCHELSISKLASPTTEELIAGGYIPQNGNVEIIENSDIPEGTLAAGARKPHEMFKQFRKRVANRTATEFSLMLWDAIKVFENDAVKLQVGFASPLDNRNLSSWEEYANRIQKNHVKSFPEKMFFVQLEKWYVALRLIVQTWEEEEQLALQWLLQSGALTPQNTYSQELKSSISSVAVRAGNSMNFMKLSCLRQHLIDKHARFGKSFRCIIFSQQRLGACIISSFINRDSHLQNLGLTSGYVAARGTSITPSNRMTPSSVNQTVAQFRLGKLKILVATSVIEEGFDVPAANCVISYNYLKDSVELCQRFGRARQQDCAIVVMEERHDRPISRLENVRQLQESMMENFDPRNDAKAANNEATEREKQRNREQCARALLIDKAKCRAQPVQVLNLYRQKTKAELESTISKESNNQIRTLITYISVTREIKADALGPSKKNSKSEASFTLLMKLRDETA